MEYYSKDEFEQLLVLWSLKGKVTQCLDMGKKGLGSFKSQVRRIVVDTKNYEATITYTELGIGDTESTFKVDYCNIRDNRTYHNKFYPGAHQAIAALQKI